METSDDFTFKRKSANKGINLAFTKINYNKETIKNKEEEFTFNRLRPNPNAKENTQLRKTNSKEGATNKKLRKTTKKNNESTVQFNVIKKRKTIRLDKSIDISSGSIIVDAPKDTCLSEDSLRIDLPVIKEKIKSNEIYKNVISNNVNDLIKECTIFLNDNSSYTKEVIKHCDANYFSDTDYRKEIELTNNKIEQVRSEINKWEKVFGKVKVQNEIAIKELIPMEIDGWLDKNEIIKEFEEKAKKLKVFDEKLRYFFEYAQEKSENLLKSVFGSLEEKNVDAIFLLKAMSRLGR